ncbi:MAG: phytanoyl-CoA dioxygenase family protein [Streptosporangiaceae bacterium]
MATITEITEQHRAAFREQGFVVIPGVLDDALLATAREHVAALLAAEPAGAELTGPYFLWPRFGAAGHPLLDVYRESGIERLAAGLLRPDLPVREPGFAQLATTIPPWPHRPGGPHVDGLTPKPPDGRPGTFSLLAGIWLTDQSRPHQGNLWIWPGTHLRFGAYLAERGADALGRVEEMRPGPYPDVELGEPVQATGPAGSVLFAHYLLAHNIGGHDGPAEAGPRQTVYYRLEADGHRERWREAVTSPLLEFA